MKFKSACRIVPGQRPHRADRFSYIFLYDKDNEVFKQCLRYLKQQPARFDTNYFASRLKVCRVFMSQTPISRYRSESIGELRDFKCSYVQNYEYEGIAKSSWTSAIKFAYLNWHF